MKKKVVVPAAFLIPALAADGLYLAHIHPLEKVVAAPAPPPAVPIFAGVVGHLKVSEATITKFSKDKPEIMPGFTDL
jgi:hypothetical protein